MEPASDPIWLTRAEALRLQLELAPMTTREAIAWGRRQGWPPHGTINVLAAVEGDGVLFARGRWTAVEAVAQAVGWS